MLESIKELQEALKSCETEAGIDDKFRTYWITADAADKLISAIEQEVSERYMPLPVDADGVPIRVGDVMEFSAFEIEKPVTRMVDGIGQGVFFAWCGERGYQQHEAKSYRHHHEPTIEDVLREFAEKITDSQIPDVHPTYEEAIAEYAQRLQLREVDE